MRYWGYSVAPIGGTGYWNAAIGGSRGIYESPVLAKNYPPGTFCISPFVSDDHQGHLSMVSTPAEPSGGGWGDQYMMQSGFTQERTSDLWGKPGANEFYTMAYTWQYIDWPTWVGLIDGVPVLDGFPGYTASAKEIALWCGDQMKAFGLPRQLFVQCSIPEMTSIWTENRYYEDISDIPGFSYAVDYDSFGPVQQRWQYYPFPWDFETSVWSFAQMALHSSYCPAPMPEASDAEACVEWIAKIQSPALEYRGRYRRLDDGTDTHA